MDGRKTSECVNLLGHFCGRRDVRALDHKELRERLHIEQADVMVLFGGSILCGADVLAGAMRNNLAKKYMIVGGEGHTTESLRRKMHHEYPELETDGLPEADVFDHYLQYRYGLRADLLERSSTNCGNNVTCCLELLKKHRVDYKNILLVQDATMQRRMDAVFRKYIPASVSVINYASYAVDVIFREGRLQYDRSIRGMWDMDRYLTLLMGEIPRLKDDAGGYGPKGRNFIAHVEIPDQVLKAFDFLKKNFGSHIRTADPLYASK